MYGNRLNIILCSQKGRVPMIAPDSVSRAITIDIDLFKQGHLVVTLQ